MRQTSIVVNFDNLHSLLGLFSSLVFELTESSDYCSVGLRKKKAHFQRKPNGHK